MSAYEKVRKDSDWGYPLTCYIVGGSLLGYLFFSTFVLIVVHLDLFTIFAKAKLLRAHIMCGSFGMIGATIASIRKFYRVIITESTAKVSGDPIQPMKWGLGWVYYYLTRPILGSFLGALCFTLSFIGFQILAEPASLQISSEGRYLLYALSFISGFAVSNVLDRLGELAEQIFQTKGKTY